MSGFKGLRVIGTNLVENIFLMHGHMVMQSTDSKLVAVAGSQTNEKMEYISETEQPFFS